MIKNLFVTFVGIYLAGVLFVSFIEWRSPIDFYNISDWGAAVRGMYLMLAVLVFSLSELYRRDFHDD